MQPTDHQTWTAGLLENLSHFGPEAEQALLYIRAHGTKLGVHDQPTGARWTACRRIELHPRFAGLSPDDPYAVSLVIHEVRHLQQGVLTALSVFGELEAWQLQFAFLKSRTGHYHSDLQRNLVLEILMSLHLDWDRRALQSARDLMQAYAGKGYRIDLLPLYPLPSEILFRLLHRQPVRDADKHE